MPPSERLVDRGQRLAARLASDLGAEIRTGRLSAGLSQAALARASGPSQPTVSRIEAGRPGTPLDDVAVVCAVLGLRLWTRVFPDGPPVRDRSHLALLRRFRERVVPPWTWSSEVPVGPGPDLRAWDVVLRGPVEVGVDAETRLHDIQALQRREELKLRDGHVDRLVLLVSSTRHNRVVLREHRDALRSTLPLDTVAVLPALRLGRDPGANGIVIL